MHKEAYKVPDGCVHKKHFEFFETKVVIRKKLIMPWEISLWEWFTIPDSAHSGRSTNWYCHWKCFKNNRLTHWTVKCQRIAEQGFALSQLGQGLLTHPWEHLSGTEAAWLFAVWESLAECSIYHNFSFIVPSAYVLLLENGCDRYNCYKPEKGYILPFFVFSFPKYLWKFSEILPLPRNFALLKAIWGLNNNSICKGTWSLERGMEGHELVPWVNCHSSLSGLGSLLVPLWTHCFVNCHDWKHEQIQWMKNL